MSYIINGDRSRIIGNIKGIQVKQNVWYDAQNPRIIFYSRTNIKTFAPCQKKVLELYIMPITK